MNRPSVKSALETQAAFAMGNPNRENQCVFHGCKNISPFTCKLSVFGKEFGCGQHFCTEHKGEISMLIFEKFTINDDDIFKERESVCYQHVEDANRRAKFFFGIPTAILTVFAIFSLVFSIFGIIDAMNEVDWDSGESLNKVKTLEDN